MTGSELARQNPKGRLLPDDAKRVIEGELRKIDEQYAKFEAELNRLTEEGSDKMRGDLLELHALTGGKVVTYDDATQFIHAITKGGRFKGQDYKSGIREQVKGMFYNSVLSSLRTPLKAIVGTNLITYLQPFQAWVGAAMGGNKQEMVVAAAQIHGINEMFRITAMGSFLARDSKESAIGREYTSGRVAAGATVNYDGGGGATANSRLNFNSIGGNGGGHITCLSVSSFDQNPSGALIVAGVHGQGFNTYDTIVNQFDSGISVTFSGGAITIQNTASETIYYSVNVIHMGTGNTTYLGR